MVCRALIPERKINLVEPIFERSRLSAEFLVVAYEEVIPVIQKRVSSPQDDASCNPDRLPKARRA